MQPAFTTISPEDSCLGYSAYVRRQFVSSPLGAGDKLARFDRVLDMQGKGYRWDNPGVRIRFTTDAADLQLLLYYNELHISGSARNSRGLYSVDGKFSQDWTFQTLEQKVQREPEFVSVALPSLNGFHDYEVVLPYGDSVDFAGLRVNPVARFKTVQAATLMRYVAYGDSITHGFSASDVGKSYPFLLGQETGWETINLGLGGRASTPEDGKLVASLNPGLVTVLMGANDWQGGVPLERYRARMAGFLDHVREEQPRVPVYLITPLWVVPSWNPAKADLEAYRRVLRDLVTARVDANLHLIEGPALIDHDREFFDELPVHPNDAGLRMMADRLAKQIAL